MDGIECAGATRAWAKREFEKGRRARLAGKGREKIPASLAASTHAHRSWVAGWEDADAGLAVHENAVAGFAGCAECDNRGRSAKAWACDMALPLPDASTLQRWLKQASADVGCDEAVSIPTNVAQRFVALATSGVLARERECCARLLELDTPALLLLAGELKAQDLRNVRAVLSQRARTIRARKLP